MIIHLMIFLSTLITCKAFSNVRLSAKLRIPDIVRYIVNTNVDSLDKPIIDKKGNSITQNLSSNQILKKLKEASKQFQVPNDQSNDTVNKIDVVSGFNKLGVLNNIVNALELQGYKEPTKVQSSVIPRILKSESIVMAASTGSGKTLAFLIPILQLLLVEEQNGYIRKPNRPRAIILTPTRELAEQILDVIKSLSHIVKISSCSVLGGEKYEIQKKAGNVFLSHVKHVVIDEVDTMFLQGFGPDIRGILRSVLSVKPSQSLSLSSLSNYLSQPPQMIFVTATLTKSVKQLLQDLTGKVDDKSDSAVFDVDFTDPDNTSTKKKSSLKINKGNNDTNIEESAFKTTVNMKIVEVDGLHRSLPNVKYHFEDCSGNGGLSVNSNKVKDIVVPTVTASGTSSLRDKLDVLIDYLTKPKYKKLKTLVFCNTVSSCRAVLYKLEEHTPGCTMIEKSDNQLSNVPTTSTTKAINPLGQIFSYHGSLNSIQRTEQLELFRSIEKGKGGVMICTDIAARGLDIQDIEHVILFDFPLNPVDFLHRSGRCGRQAQGGLQNGLVTSLLMKRDLVLAQAILSAISKGLPLDSLSSSKKDYQDRGKFATVVGRISKEESNIRIKQKQVLRNEIYNVDRGTKTEKDRYKKYKSNNNTNKSNDKNINEKSDNIENKLNKTKILKNNIFSKLNKRNNKYSNDINEKKKYFKKRG